MNKEFYDRILQQAASRGLVRDDMELLYERLVKDKPQTIVEIGARYGCSTLLFGQFVSRYGGHVYSVEPNPRQRWQQNIRETGLQDCVTLIKAASPWVHPADIPPTIDFLFIDGDHRFRWAIVDYHFWIRYVPIGGLIAFHDSVYIPAVKEAVEIVQRAGELQEIARTTKSRQGTVVFRKIASAQYGRLAWQPKILYVGRTRTATKSIAQFFGLFGVDSKHQAAPMPGMEMTLAPYDLDNPPPHILKYVKKRQLYDFEANWELLYFIQLLQQKEPNLDVLVGIRDPKEQCNSYRNYRKVHHGDKEPQPLEYWAAKYAECYRFILEQSRRMIRKPRWVDFDRYVAGEYTLALLDLYEIPASQENLHKAQEHLVWRVNSRGDYPVEDNAAFDGCREAIADLKAECEEMALVQ